MAGHPADVQLQHLVQHFQVQPLPPRVGVVEVQQDDGTVDLRWEKEEMGPGPQRVPVALLGPFAVKVQPGARALVVFMDGSEAGAVVLAYLSGAFTAISTDASTVKIGGTSIEIGKTATDISLGLGKSFIAATGDPVTATAIGPVTNAVVKV